MASAEPSEADRLSSMIRMATLMQDSGRLGDAEILYREALDGFRRLYGENHPTTLSTVGRVAGLWVAQGKLGDAEPLYREALAGRRRTLGDSHKDTGHSAYNLGELLIDRSDRASAQPFLRLAVNAYIAALGAAHSEATDAAYRLSTSLDPSAASPEDLSLLLTCYRAHRASVSKETGVGGEEEADEAEEEDNDVEEENDEEEADDGDDDADDDEAPNALVLFLLSALPASHPDRPLLLNDAAGISALYHKHKLRPLRDADRFCDACGRKDGASFFSCSRCGFDLCPSCHAISAAVKKL